MYQEENRPRLVRSRSADGQFVIGKEEQHRSSSQIVFNSFIWNKWENSAPIHARTFSFVVHLFQGDWKIHATIKEMCRSLDPATVEKRNFNEYMRLFTQAKIWIGRWMCFLQRSVVLLILALSTQPGRRQTRGEPHHYKIANQLCLKRVAGVQNVILQGHHPQGLP